MTEENPFSSDLEPIIFDRSTLEREADCPAQAMLIEKYNLSTGGEMADIGTECHDILSRACGLRVELATQRQIKEFIDDEAVKSRPDLQPRVIMALRNAAWKVSEILCRFDNNLERAPEDLILFDGGKGNQSGQLSAQIYPATESRGPVWVTCEVDLALAMPSPEEMDVWDYKSGWTHWTAGRVGESFQFQCYSYIIFQNFPELNRINYRVYMTAENSATSIYTFERQFLYPIIKRVEKAVDLALERRANPASAKPWPSPVKCSICPAARHCADAFKPESDLAIDPDQYLRDYARIRTAADQMEASLTQYVRMTRNGEDLIVDDIAFGPNKPKTERTKAMLSIRPARHKGRERGCAKDSHGQAEAIQRRNLHRRIQDTHAEEKGCGTAASGGNG